MRTNFYRSGQQLSGQGHGQAEGMQAITAAKRQGSKPCPKDGCERWEKGYSITLDLSDEKDANLYRYIREGKAGQHKEAALVEGAIRIDFFPGQCTGHRLQWEDDEAIYFAGTTPAGRKRRTTHDEYQERYQVGGDALIEARTRLKEMNEA
jgi:hypothetical protein